MKILQLNLNHCIAQDLLKKTMFEKKFDIALLSEHHYNSSELGWITDANNKTSIIVKPADLIQKKSEPSIQYYCWVKTRGVFYFSCYIPPSCDINQFTVIIEDIVEACSDKYPAVSAATLMHGQQHGEAKEQK